MAVPRRPVEITFLVRTEEQDEWRRRRRISIHHGIINRVTQAIQIAHNPMAGAHKLFRITWIGVVTEADHGHATVFAEFISDLLQIGPLLGGQIEAKVQDHEFPAIIREAQRFAIKRCGGEIRRKVARFEWVV
jgi:hypothetical protein